jgi:hypothetical protein
LPYYHVVFTLPAAIGAIAYQNKAVVYGLLFKAASEAMLTIAADPKHLGARIGMTAVLHIWGIILPSAAMHESVAGTFRTCRAGLTMSAVEGRTDVPREPCHFRFLPTADIGFEL